MVNPLWPYGMMSSNHRILGPSVEVMCCNVLLHSVRVDPFLPQRLKLPSFPFYPHVARSISVLLIKQATILQPISIEIQFTSSIPVLIQHPFKPHRLSHGFHTCNGHQAVSKPLEGYPLNYHKISMVCRNIPNLVWYTFDQFPMKTSSEIVCSLSAM